MLPERNIYSVAGKKGILLFLLPVMLLLYGCPYSSPYKLDTEPSVNIDEAILGKWKTVIKTQNGKEQPVKMLIGKKSPMEYEITFTGYLNNSKSKEYIKEDSISGTAFISLINNIPFLNITINNQNFITRLIYENDKLSLLPLAERFTAKYIKTSADLRTAVEFHIKTRLRPVYDESSSLICMVRAN